MGSFEEELYNLNKRNEEKIQETFKRLGEKIPLFIAIAITIWWLLYDSIEIEQATLSFRERFSVTCITIVLSLIFRSLIADGGYGSAKKTTMYTLTMNQYDEARQKGLSKQRQIMAYTNAIALKNLHDCRKVNLQSNDLKYEDFFNEEGEYIGCDYKHSKNLNKRQKQVIKKAIKQRVIVPSVFGYFSSKWFGLKKEKTQRGHQVKSTISNFFFCVALSFATVGVSFKFVGINLDSFIYAFCQILLWTASGYIQRVKNFNFIIDEIVPFYKEKTNIITSYFELSYNERAKYEEDKCVTKKESEEQANVE